MYLFVFEAHKKWQYCGGGAVILAESNEECVQVWEQHLPTIDPNCDFDRTYYPSLFFIPDDAHPCDQFVLVEKFPLTMLEKSRVVMASWNYA